MHTRLFSPVRFTPTTWLVALALATAACNGNQPSSNTEEFYTMASAANIAAPLSDAEGDSLAALVAELSDSLPGISAECPAVNAEPVVTLTLGEQTTTVSTVQLPAPLAALSSCGLAAVVTEALQRGLLHSLTLGVEGYFASAGLRNCAALVEYGGFVFPLGCNKSGEKIENGDRHFVFGMGDANCHALRIQHQTFSSKEVVTRTVEKDYISHFLVGFDKATADEEHDGFRFEYEDLPFLDGARKEKSRRCAGAVPPEFANPPLPALPGDYNDLNYTLTVAKGTPIHIIGSTINTCGVQKEDCDCETTTEASRDVCQLEMPTASTQPAYCDRQNYQPEGIPLTAVKRVWSPTLGDHLFSASSEECPAPDYCGYSFEGQPFSVPPSASIDARVKPVYRWYEPNTHDHFLTLSAGEACAALPATERDGASECNGELLSQYVFEGQAFSAYDEPVAGTVAYHRWYAPRISDHFYGEAGEACSKLPANERDGSAECKSELLSEYDYEHVAFYAYPERFGSCFRLPR